MTHDDYCSLLRQALTAPHGIALRLGNFDKAANARAASCTASEALFVAVETDHSMA